MKEVTAYLSEPTKMVVDAGANFITYVDREVDFSGFNFEDRSYMPPFSGLKTRESQIIKHIKNTPYGPECEYISMHPKLMDLFGEEVQRRINAEKRSSYFKQKSKYLEEKISIMESQFEERMRRAFGG